MKAKKDNILEGRNDMIKDRRIEEVKDLPNNEGENWFTIQETIEELKISYASLYQKIRYGKIKAVNWRGITFISLKKKEDKI